MTRKFLSVITTVWGVLTALEGGALLLALIKLSLDMSCYLDSPILVIFIIPLLAVCILLMIPSALLLKCGIIMFKCGISGINGANSHELKMWSIVSIVINAVLCCFTSDLPTDGILTLPFLITPIIGIALSIAMLILSSREY